MNDFDYDAHIKSLIENYKGDAPILGNAIGMMILGRHVGWRVIRMIYSTETYIKYERILGIELKTIIPERGEFAYKSLGLAIIDAIGGYWNFVNSRRGTPELKQRFHIFA